MHQGGEGPCNYLALDFSTILERSATAVNFFRERCKWQIAWARRATLLKEARPEHRLLNSEFVGSTRHLTENSFKLP